MNQKEWLEKYFEKVANSSEEGQVAFALRAVPGAKVSEMPPRTAAQAECHMNQNEWLEQYFEKVANSSEEGQEAVIFVKQNQVKVGLKRARKSVGAFWTLSRRFYLNTFYYSMESSLENPRAWTLFVHEVHHLKQGIKTAMSVYGELDAWQMEFRLFKKLTGKTLKPELEELLSLPLNFDRNNLSHARKLMTKFAGFWYGAWILPLYPIDKEIKFLFTRKMS